MIPDIGNINVDVNGIPLVGIGDVGINDIQTIGV